MNSNRLFYKPNPYKIAIDVIAWIITLSILLIWRVSAEKYSIINYIYVFGGTLGYWLVVAYFFQRYRPRKRYRFLKELGIVLIVSLTVLATFYIGIEHFASIFKNVSLYVITSMILIMFII